MTADGNHKKRKCFRTPSSLLCTSTAVMLTYMGLCVLLCILAASGFLLNNQSFECGNNEEEASRLEKEASLVYLTAGLNVIILCLELVTMWIRNVNCSGINGLLAAVFFVVITMVFAQVWVKEKEEIQAFKERYLTLIPFTTESGKTQNCVNDDNCTIINNVHHWQAEYKCCGLEGYKDWGSAIPHSCLCGVKDDSSECVEAGHSLIYTKPCFPTVLSLVSKRSSTFWIVMIVWMIIIAVPGILSLALCIYCAYLLCCLDCYALGVWKHKLSGGEKLIPVVFIRKDNNNQTEEDEDEEENAKDGEVKKNSSNGVVLEVEEGTTVQGEGAEMEEEEQRPNALTAIPLSLLERLQRELDPPPVQHQVRCLCIFPSKPRNFYTVMIEESSPLLPSNAVLADAKKPTDCFFVEGPHIFVLEHIVWPKENKPEGTSPVLHIDAL